MSADAEQPRSVVPFAGLPQSIAECVDYAWKRGDRSAATITRRILDDFGPRNHPYMTWLRDLLGIEPRLRKLVSDHLEKRARSDR